MTDRDRLAALALKIVQRFNTTSGTWLSVLEEELLAAGVTLPPEPERPIISASLYDRIAEVLGVMWSTTNVSLVVDRRQRLAAALSAEGYVPRPVLTEEDRNNIAMHERTLPDCGMLKLVHRLTGGGK